MIKNMEKSEILKRLEVIEKQSYKVTKSNEIVQKAKTGMSLQEQKIIAFLVSKINVNETDPYKYYIFNTKEFCELCEIDSKNYVNVRRTLKRLYDRESIEIFQNGCYVPLKWLGDYEIQMDKSKVSVQLHFRMVPYLIQLKKNFVSYRLNNILFLKNKFRVSLYELFSSYSFRGEFDISLDELRSYLGIVDNEYMKVKIFKRNIIKKSIEEINDKTNLRLKYKDLKAGRRITGFKFLIESIPE